MSYLALARKWRPRTFSQLIGQEHINRALMNALTQQRLHHAYLFTGTRGVGKTSIARILAKALNCEEGIRAEPCLQCDACLAIEQGRFIDLIEIDGASKTRVEDTRDLLDNVQYVPTSGRFKIYLIDEVHMLSQHSFNALLKTLEEPPAHVKFILATTDPQKLPATILSRCLQFHLKHLPNELISHHLQQILKEEQKDYEIPALEILAQAARGSMRDALSLLDQAITSCDAQLQASDVKVMLGYTQQDYAIKLLQALAEQNANMLLSLSQQIAKEGGHFQYVLDELLHYFHQISIYQSVGEHNPFITPSAEIIALGKQFTAEDIQLFYQFGLKSCEEIHLAPTLAIGFTMMVLRMLIFRPAPHPSVPALAFQQNKSIETSTNNDILSQAEAIIETVSITKPPIEPCSSPLNDWFSIIPELKLTGLALSAVENAEFISKEGQNLNLRVNKNHQSLFTPSILTRIETSLTHYYQSTVKIILDSEILVQNTLAHHKEKIAQQKQQLAEAALDNDPLFHQLQKDFSAELIKNSIEPLEDSL